MKLSKEEIQSIAKLARLELNEEEVAMYSHQLTDVLEYVEMLQEVDTTGVEETCQVTGLTNVFREDTIEDADPQTKQALIESFPDRTGSLLRVQAVFDASIDE